MKSHRNLSVFIFLIILITGCSPSTGYGQNMLKLEKEIPLTAIIDRIDHMDIDVKDQVAYVAALGNNTVEVVNLRSGKILHSITGLSEPQGVGYMPKHHELLVANGGTGECIFFNAAT